MAFIIINNPIGIKIILWTRLTILLIVLRIS